VLAAMLAASKFHDDDYFANAHWAKIGGVPTAELNDLEASFLFAIGFRLHSALDEYRFCLDQLCASAESSGSACEGTGADRKEPPATTTMTPQLEDASRENTGGAKMYDSALERDIEPMEVGSGDEHSE